MSFFLVFRTCVPKIINLQTKKQTPSIRINEKQLLKVFTKYVFIRHLNIDSFFLLYLCLFLYLYLSISFSLSQLFISLKCIIKERRRKEKSKTIIEKFSKRAQRHVIHYVNYIFYVIIRKFKFVVMEINEQNINN